MPTSPAAGAPRPRRSVTGSAVAPAAGRRPAVLMICHSYFEEDARIRREVSALIGAGYEVDVVALRAPGVSARDVVDGARVERIDVQHVQGRGVVGYVSEYLRFLVAALFRSTALHRRRRYRLAQVHTLPDFLVFAAAPLRMAGVPVVLDLHEAMPPFFRSRFEKLGRPPFMAALELVERVSIGAATAAITVNESLRARLVERGVPADKVTVILNSPDLSMFDATKHPFRPFMADGVLRLVYAGSLTPLYDVESIVEAVAILATGSDGGPAMGPDVAMEIFGRGDSESRLRELIDARGLGGQVTLRGRVPVEQIAAEVAACDVGVAPTRRDPYTELSMSTKLFEYAALGKPVLASRLMTVERYFGREALTYFEPGDARSAAAALRGIVADHGARVRQLELTGEIIERLAWRNQAAEYVALVDRLTGRSR